MDVHLLEMLETLSNKLGTTTDRLYKVLVKQAKLDAMITFITLGMCLFAIIPVLHGWFNSTEFAHQTEFDHSGQGADSFRQTLTKMNFAFKEKGIKNSIRFTVFYQDSTEMFYLGMTFLADQIGYFKSGITT